MIVVLLIIIMSTIAAAVGYKIGVKKTRTQYYDKTIPVIEFKAPVETCIKTVEIPGNLAIEEPGKCEQIVNERLFFAYRNEILNNLEITSYYDPVDNMYRVKARLKFIKPHLEGVDF